MDPITIIKAKKILACAIVAGMLLYLSKFLRNYFNDNDSILFILGLLPNFGLAFALPFIYVSNRVRQKKQVNYFNIACIVTFLLMVLNEIRDKYQPGRVFDMLDIYASFAGVILAFFVFQVLLKKLLSQ